MQGKVPLQRSTRHLCSLSGAALLFLPRLRPAGFRSPVGRLVGGPRVAGLKCPRPRFARHLCSLSVAALLFLPSSPAPSQHHLCCRVKVPPTALCAHTYAPFWGRYTISPLIPGSSRWVPSRATVTPLPPSPAPSRYVPGHCPQRPRSPPPQGLQWLSYGPLRGILFVDSALSRPKPAPLGYLLGGLR